jgi:minor extracellular serine protease Vpr
MKCLWLLLACTPLFAAGFVPGRYIVELSDESVVAHMVRLSPRTPARLSLRSAEADLHRRHVMAQQDAAAAAIQAVGGEVLDAIQEASNVLVVRIPDAQASQLASIPGVSGVYRERTFHLLLDHALPLHHVPDAWAQVGAANAGAGIRIAIIDTGIDVGHPGFLDTGFTAPSTFPKGTAGYTAYTNNKVIVARSYASRFAATDPDPSPADHVGHGTATAMAAGGVQNTGPLATISGVAPRAYIGSYKVFGTPGVNDSTTESAVLAAISDAVADGMDVISMSLGSDVAPPTASDLEVTALASAAAAGVIVVAAAGNNGSDPMTISSPASGAMVIAVGASANDRLFAASVVVPGGGTFEAAPGSASVSAAAVTGPLADITKFDSTSLACSSLPAGSLTGSVALILRGTCTFETKLNNAKAAGAIGGLVYDNMVEPIFTMAVGAATLPADLISNADGFRVKELAAHGVGVTRHPAVSSLLRRFPNQPPQQSLPVTLQFALAPTYTSPAQLASFSAEGPNIDLAIKPDLVAVGLNMYTAAQKLDPNGDVYNSTGYAVEQGTSFSTPLVAGTAALVKAARPGLTSAQYRSLIVNSADGAYSSPGTAAGVQQAGTGVLNVLKAINATAAAAPVSLSFGAGGATVSATVPLTVWNVGTASDAFRVLVVPTKGAAAPTVSSATVDLAAGLSTQLAVQFSAAGLAAGSYEGYVTIQGSQSGVATRVPYWYAVQSNTPANITILYNIGTATAGTRQLQVILFRVTDATGIPMTVTPTVSAVSGGGQVLQVQSVASQSPYTYAISLKMGSVGANVFRIQVGSLTKDVTITGQ